VRAGKCRHCPGAEELGWVGQPVERAEQRQGPASGAAKGGGQRQPGPAGRRPGEPELGWGGDRAALGPSIREVAGPGRCHRGQAGPGSLG
jgi:hypothetical protein